MSKERINKKEAKEPDRKLVAATISQIARIRNVDVTYVAETLRQSIIAGLKRRYGPDVKPEVMINPETGDINIYLVKTLVETVTNDGTEITAYDADAQQVDKGVKHKLGDEVTVKLPFSEIGRIAIRKASEELVLKLREAERTKLYDEYMKKRGEIVTGTIQKIGREGILVNLGLVEALLDAQEQLKTDHYRQGAPIKALVHRVDKTAVGPRILLSRTHPDFLRRLLEKEIPEIRQGIVEIRGIARAPTFRSKVAVFSADERVDPVGACVGYRKSRIENVIKELSGEKIDIVQWSKDAQVFITRALGPARVKEVIPEGDTYIVVVPDEEFSIAIGKKGQNVWLASLLVGVKLEVLKETDYDNRAIMARASRVSIADLRLGPELTTKLQDAQILTAFDLLSITTKELSEATGIASEEIEELKKRVSSQMKLDETEEEEEVTEEETGAESSEDDSAEAGTSEEDEVSREEKTPEDETVSEPKPEE